MDYRTKGVRIILGLILSSLIITSLQKLVKNESGTKTYYEIGTRKFPTLNICPFFLTQETFEVAVKSNFTWNDFIELPNMTESISVNIVVMNGGYYENRYSVPQKSATSYYICM